MCKKANEKLHALARLSTYTDPIVKVVDSSNSGIGTAMKNNNKFANLLLSNNVNSSSRQVKSLTSITATKIHTAHLTLTCGRNSNNTTAVNDE